jgi:hypothetical protein
MDYNKIFVPILIIGYTIYIIRSVRKLNHYDTGLDMDKVPSLCKPYLLKREINHAIFSLFHLVVVFS